VADKKKPAKSSGKSRIPWAALFWLVFVIFIFGLFLFNREDISNSIRIIQNEIVSRRAPVGEMPLPEPPGLITEPVIVVSPPPAPLVQPLQEPAPSQVTAQDPQPQAGHGLPLVQMPQAEQAVQAELRERSLYFIQVDRGGSILRVKIERRLPVSNSPMTDVIQTLIAGPNEEERRRGLISLIPPDTRLLSAAVRGHTAIINFSEDFLYNTYGVEGYAAQLRQIVFTVTEFPNIRDVQILIEGRQVDYLGEGIWMGSPLTRDML
jgi:hypothetical protein